MRRWSDFTLFLHNLFPESVPEKIVLPHQLPFAQLYKTRTYLYDRGVKLETPIQLWTLGGNTSLKDMNQCIPLA